MKASWNRIQAMFFRYAILHKRSLPRTFEVVFWPVMELLVWGFVSVYFSRLADDSTLHIMSTLISAMIFWDILYRSQQGVTIPIVEDVWTQNIINLFIAPLRLWEWLAATFLYGAVKILCITLLLTVIAYFLYQYSFIGVLHFYWIPLAANLLLFGWALGVFTAALLIRFGHAVEALIWGIPFLFQPLSAIYYPLDVLPVPVQWISLMLPSTHVFEGMRQLVQTASFPWQNALIGLLLNILYFLAAACFFKWMYRIARDTGRLGRLGTE